VSFTENKSILGLVFKMIR